jgi:hypothetical protein
MDMLTDPPINWANVNWPYVIVLVLLVFVCQGQSRYDLDIVECLLMTQSGRMWRRL